MSDQFFQNFSTVQSILTDSQPGTIPSAGTVAPQNFVTFISGTAAIANITPPVTGAHLLCFIPTGAFTMTAAGNISIAMGAATVGQPIFLVYVPATKKYYAGKVTSA